MSKEFAIPGTANYVGATAGKVHLHEMVTHKFPLARYQDMIEVNMRKSANRAVKTAVTFI